MRTGRLAIASIAVLAAGLAPAAGAQGRMPTYEPQQRLRTALDVCGKNEVMRGAYCVRKCAADFRMDLAAKPPKCVGLKADATYTPPQPNYTPPASNPNAKPVPGA
ncbi:MAG: hypothetical protein IPH30_16350 [Betaproteobacteria bacterium]|nr:hypothetical protein [Betaproteobacteria bacterium]